MIITTFTVRLCTCSTDLQKQITRCLNDVAEDWTPPGPVVVIDHVGGVGHEWSVVCVELARLVRKTVVVRVTDR